MVVAFLRGGRSSFRSRVAIVQLRFVSANAKAPIGSRIDPSGAASSHITCIKSLLRGSDHKQLFATTLQPGYIKMSTVICMFRTKQFSRSTVAAPHAGAGPAAAHATPATHNAADDSIVRAASRHCATFHKCRSRDGLVP
jgi:hypothetical protein